MAGIDQEPQTDPDIQSNDRPWTLTFLLANLCHGKCKSPSSQGLSPPDRTEERFRLIKPFLKHDVILMQEITIADKLQQCDELKDYHKVLENSEAGMLLNRTKFGMGAELSEEDLNSILSKRAECRKYFKDFKKQFQEGRMCIRKATLTNGNDSILLVSYHGPQKSKSLEDKSPGISPEVYGELYTNFIISWRLIQDYIRAQHLVIGGDFNFPVEKFREMVLYHEHGLRVCSQVNRTEHRKRADSKDKDKIDYFVVSKSLELVECVMAQRLDWKPDLVTYADYYFDHDPVLATFSASAGTTDPLTHIMRELSLASGPSVIAREAAIDDMQRTHFAAVLEVLRSKFEEWKDFTTQELSDILRSKDKIKSMLDVKELKVILEYLQINMHDPTSATEKEVLIKAISRIRIKELKDSQYQNILSMLKEEFDIDSNMPDRKLVRTILQSQKTLCQLDNQILTSIITNSQIPNPSNHEMLVDILYQVYQWPLCEKIHKISQTPSYGELHDEFDGMNRLNIPK